MERDEIDYHQIARTSLVSLLNRVDGKTDDAFWLPGYYDSPRRVCSIYIYYVKYPDNTMSYTVYDSLSPVAASAIFTIFNAND
jgi:hypothetical protein